MMAWTFDPKSGIYRNADLSAKLLWAAMLASHVNGITIGPDYDGVFVVDKHTEHLMYIDIGQRRISLTDDDRIIEAFTPSLAAFIGKHTTFVLAPELRASIPANLGQVRSVCWYAVTEKQRALCKKPIGHAPDCECGML